MAFFLCIALGPLHPIQGGICTTMRLCLKDLPSCFPGSENSSWENSLTIPFSGHYRPSSSPYRLFIKLSERPTDLCVHTNFLLLFQWCHLSQEKRQRVLEITGKEVYKATLYSHSGKDSWPYTMGPPHQANKVQATDTHDKWTASGLWAYWN